MTRYVFAAVLRWLSRPPATGPRPTSGADETYAGELRALRDIPIPVELSLKPAEQMVVDHEALAGISAALDHFDRTVSDHISRFLRHQPTTVVEMVGGK